LTTRKSVFHSLAFTLVKNSWVASLSTCHWLVVLILGKTVSKTVTDQDRLQVDVAVLVGQDFRGEDGNVMAGIRFTSDVEVLCGVFGELFEEKGKECINIFSSCNSVANGSATVRVTNVDWLIEEDDGSVCIP
jgi:hypothetical protein